MHGSSVNVQRAKGLRCAERPKDKTAQRAQKSSTQGPWAQMQPNLPFQECREHLSHEGRMLRSQPVEERGEERFLRRRSLEPPWSKQPGPPLPCIMATASTLSPLPMPHPTACPQQRKSDRIPLLKPHHHHHPASLHSYLSDLTSSHPPCRSLSMLHTA